MTIQKRLLVTLCLILWALPALAGELPEFHPQGTQQFADYGYTADYTCDVWVYPAGTPHEGWLLACLEAGFTLQKTQVEGYSVYKVMEDGGRYAMLFPEYSGTVMLMIQKGMTYGPQAPTPAPKPDSPSGGHWESVLVEVDCPACVGGVCDLCKGTGTFRLYGTASDCPRQCQTCDGEGSYTTSQMVFVYD